MSTDLYFIMGLKNKKEDNFSEWFTEINLETGADLVDMRYGVQGFVVHKPLAIKIIRRIENYLEDEVERDNYQPILLPVAISEKAIEREKEHVEGFAPELLWVTRGGSKELEEKLFLRPTGESQFYPMYSQWIRAHTDLPMKRYQSRIMVYRFEKTTRPWLRGREFVFFETHAVFKDHKSVMSQIKKDIKTTKNVIRNKLAIPYMYFQRPQWDKFAGAVNTYAADVLMPDGRVNQIASTHDLGQKFAKAYSVKFKNTKGKFEYGWQTCYGPGIWRVMASLIGIHADNNGLILPFDLAPTQIVIVPILKKKGDRKIIGACNKLKDNLSEKYRVELDDSARSPGFKFNKWEMLGASLRMEVGPKEAAENKVTVVRRDTKQKSVVPVSRLNSFIKKTEEDIQRVLLKRAQKYLKDGLYDARTLGEINDVLNKKKGFARTEICSVDSDGKKCADKIQNFTKGGKVRGTRTDKQEKPKSKCPVCGKRAKAVVYVAKQY